MHLNYRAAATNEHIVTLIKQAPFNFLLLERVLISVCDKWLK